MVADSPVHASNGTARLYANGKQGSNGAHKLSSPRRLAKPRPEGDYYGHDREEVTRVLIQALSDLGYPAAAASVKDESGFQLDSPAVASFRNAVLRGSWTEAEELLFGASTHGDPTGIPGNGLVLADGADKDIMRFFIRQQKYLEMLERQDSGKALNVLRTELMPLYQDASRLRFLSSLLMNQNEEDLKIKAGWDGAQGYSRQILLSHLSKSISPSVMLPEHRLASLLDQVKSTQIERCLWHSDASSPSLYSDHVCDREDYPTENVLELDEHDHEVWQVVFSHDGTKLASCGDQGEVVIWDVPSFEVHIHLESNTEHAGGVGNVAWSWDDTMFVTCCSDKFARLFDAQTGELIAKMGPYQEPVSSCVWLRDDKSFLVGSLDIESSLSQFDRSGHKIHTDWQKPEKNEMRRVEDLAISPDGQLLAAMNHSKHIQIYNVATRQIKYFLNAEARLMSISISQDSRYLLANHRDGVAELIDLTLRQTVQRYASHSGSEFMIRNAFGGANESFVVSGSDNGFIFIWHKTSGQLVEKLSGHAPRTNAIAWCPSDPRLLASCGDDGKVKIWSNNEWRRRNQGTMIQRMSRH